jgi:hypothetical protein
MIHLDRLTIKTTKDAILDMDLKKFNFGAKSVMHEKTCERINKKWMIKNNLGYGIKQIWIDDTDKYSDTVRLDLTGKVVYNKYYEMVTVDTFEQAVDHINSYGIIKFDKDKLYNSSILQKTDVTNNLRLDNIPSYYMGMLKRMTINDNKYKWENYQSGDVTNGMVFKNKVITRTIKERLLCYDKYEQLCNKDKIGMRMMQENIIKLKDFKNVLRIESNLNSFRKMRQYLGIDETEKFIMLKDALESDALPNYRLIEKITRVDNQQYLDLFKYKNIKSLNQFEKLVGRQHIIKICDYDIEKVRELLKSYLASKNISRYIREYRALITNRKTDAEKSIENRALTEIKEKLLVA